MQCCAPFCSTTAEVVSLSTGITFHEFPSEEHLRAAWLRALGKQDSHPPDSAVVCSQHFMYDDFYATESGSRQIRDDAIPSTVQVCMICFDTQSKMYPMSKYKLDEAYQHLVGQPLCVQGNLKQTLCVQCAQRLVNYNKFRDKSLRARSLMMELVERHESITMQHTDIFNEMNNQLKYNIVMTVLKPDHCDLYVHTDRQTDLLSTVKPVVKSETSEVQSETSEVQSETSEVKSETSEVKSGVSDESVTVDSDHTMMTSEDNDTDSFNTPDAFIEQTDPLLTIPSTCKETVETLAPIKQEVTFACTICMMEFADEDMYNHHTTMHMEANQNQDEYVIPDYSCASVAAMDVDFGTNVHPTEVTDNIEKNSNEIGQTVKIEIEVDTRNTESDPFPINKENNIYGKCQKENRIDIYNTQAKITKYSNKKPIYSNSDVTIKFPCTLCNFKTNTGKKLASHIDAHLKKNDIKIIFGCDHCDYITSTKNDLIKHLNVHAGETPFACNFCNYKTMKPSLLQNHVRKHTGEKRFSCVFCDFKCGSPSYFRQHRKTHTGENSAFACKFCDYTCIHSSVLLRHLRTHTGERPFSCELCPHKSSRKSDLLKHVKNHTSDKPYCCELCDYKCMRSNDLGRHMGIHTGEKPYSCDMCKFKCARPCSLAQHRCKYSCSRRSDLARHKRTHTGEKPFTCDVCQFKCTKRTSLVQHIMRTHNL